jgi:hypothetical protein
VFYPKKRTKNGNIKKQVIRKTVGLKGEKLTGDWRKFHEELYKL